MTNHTRPAGGWTTHTRRTAFDRGGVRVELADVTEPTGHRTEQAVVHLPSVAVALVVVDDRVLVLATTRYASGTEGWEVPGGAVDDGEDPARAAAREAAEETGWRPVGPGRVLLGFDPLPGEVAGSVHVHLWGAAEPVDGPLDPREPGRARWVHVDDVARMAAAGELLGSGTLVAVLYYLAERAAAV